LQEVDDGEEDGEASKTAGRLLAIYPDTERPVEEDGGMAIEAGTEASDQEGEQPVHATTNLVKM
jgi:hypothetical protein